MTAPGGLIVGRRLRLSQRRHVARLRGRYRRGVRGRCCTTGHAHQRGRARQPRALAHIFQETHPVDEFHHDEPNSPVRDQLVEAHQVGMGDIGDAAELALEALQRRRSEPLHRLQGHNLTTRPVESAVDDSHAAMAYLAQDLVPSKGGTVPIGTDQDRGALTRGFRARCERRFQSVPLASPQPYFFHCHRIHHAPRDVFPPPGVVDGLGGGPPQPGAGRRSREVRPRHPIRHLSPPPKGGRRSEYSAPVVLTFSRAQQQK